MPITDKDGNKLSISQVIEKILIRIKTVHLELVTSFTTVGAIQTIHFFKNLIMKMMKLLVHQAVVLPQFIEQFLILALQTLGLI